MTGGSRLADHVRKAAAKGGELARLRQDRAAVAADLAAAQAESAVQADARDALNAVLAATQAEVVGVVEELVGQALAGVYGPDHAFKLDFEVKRNQSEATPWVLRGGERYSPRDEVGGGVVDVCSVALRLAIWAITTPRAAPLFVFDEPAKHLDAARQPAFGALLRELGELLGVQTLVISHAAGIIGQADKAWEVRLEDGISTVEGTEDQS